MRRIDLPDGTWFDADTAMPFPEDTSLERWHFPPWCHEALYRTLDGVWILHRYRRSGCMGDIPSFVAISESDACGWLILNGYANEDKRHLFHSMPELLQRFKSVNCGGKK